MKPVHAALWYIESHFRDDLTLEDIAEIAGVTRFHLARAFRFATGLSVMRYLRARRLSEAARSLAAGETDILGVAVAFGYGSHEAFTRAFREQFGVTPTDVRRCGRIDNLQLLEAIHMNQPSKQTIAEPRIVDEKTLLIGGIGRTHRGSNAAMPAQWQDFGPYIGSVPGQRGNVAYGVLYNDAEGSIDYLTGVEVADFAELPADFAHLRVAAQRYAVFSHAGHISTISDTWTAIWSEWFPNSDHEAADAPMFERYPESFDARTGSGGFEIWIPIKG
jgi:AraC family transcriptional regulator